MTLRRVLLLVALLLVACGSDEPTAPANALDTKADVVREFGAGAARIGVRITRAGRTAEEGGTDYVKGGAHLALYVEPVDTAAGATPAAYIDRMAALARLFVPPVLERYPDIASLDVCQEPPGAYGEEDNEPETVLVVYRDEIGDVDWDALDAKQLVALNRERPRRLNLGVSPRISESEEWKALHG